MRRKRPDWTSPSAIAGVLRPLGFERYAEYLASDHWRDLRRRYRESDRPQRCACGVAGRQLHHLTYERLGAEMLTDLELVCEDCHLRAHGIKSKRRVRVERRRKPLALRPPGATPRHLRPLPGTVEIPAPEPLPKKRSSPKRGEPKPWEWDARPSPQYDGRRRKKRGRRR